MMDNATFPDLGDFQHSVVDVIIHTIAAFAFKQQFQSNSLLNG